MEKKYSWFGFSTGIAFLIASAAFYQIVWSVRGVPVGTPSPDTTEEETTTRVPTPAKPTAAPPTLQRIEGPPTLDKIKELQQKQSQETSDSPGDEMEEKQQPNAPTAQAKPANLPLAVRRTKSTRMFTPGEVLDIALTVQGKPDKSPNRILIDEMIPKGWVFKEVTNSTPPLNTTPQPNTTDSLQFGWDGPSQYPLQVNYKLQSAPEISKATLLQGQATCIFGDEQNTMTIGATPLYPKPAAGSNQ